jgi:hypothetical protein
VPNYLYLQWPGFQVRLHATIWEVYWYRATDNPTNFSFAQRIELWKGSWIAFKEKPIFGWGTGDIFIAVRYGLETMESKMENYHMKPHNQYLFFCLPSALLDPLPFMQVISYLSKHQAPINTFLLISFW